jgi:hypothetical protein
MATMTESPSATGIRRAHEFHAEAHVLSGELQRPIQQKIEPHVPVSLRDERGGHLTRFTEDVSIEGLITFETGHTRVSGSKSLKHHGWVTLSTSILEGLNVFEIITADRMVAQVSTDHPYESGHVPHVTFLGTKFENLQVGGFPLKLNLNLDVCGKKPNGDKSYLTNSTFLEDLKKRTTSIARAGFLPETLRKQYDDRLAEIKAILDSKGEIEPHQDKPVKVTCSLIESIDIKGIPIPGLETVGNLLVIPNFGAVALAEIEVGVERTKPNNGFQRQAPEPKGLSNNGNSRLSNYFQLKMLNMELGCVGHGSISANTVKSNGNTYP